LVASAAWVFSASFLPAARFGQLADSRRVGSRTADKSRSFLGRLRSLGSARFGISLAPRAGESVDLDNVDVRRLARGIARLNSPLSTGAKRASDILLSLALLLVSSPVLLIVAILIPLESRGPVFYRQCRVGKDGKHFDIIKFRSMVQNAEANGVQWAAQNDSRITRIGQFIRKTRIDEVPQAFNVLKGDMSFVGPRPERPEFVELLNKHVPYYELRHTVKPGITGWAQVKCEYGASIEDAAKKQRFDLHYLTNGTLVSDVIIVLMTVRVALFGIGAR
ncbi:MAG: exopolysaccharide biosynthesis polyprenyl glycosylphosphotransferase, partial [Pseudomonadota bacterium]